MHHSLVSGHLDSVLLQVHTLEFPLCAEKLLGLTSRNVCLRLPFQSLSWLRIVWIVAATSEFSGISVLSETYPLLGLAN